MALGRSWVALGMDSCWLLSVLAGFLMFSSLTSESMIVIWCVWPSLALIAMSVGVVRARIAEASVHRQRVVGSWNYLLEYSLGNAGVQGSVLVGGLLGGVEWSAGLRGALTALGPVGIIFSGLLPSLLYRSRDRADARFVARVSSLFGTTSLVWGIASVLVVERFGASFFGESAGFVQAMMGAMAVVGVLNACSTGPLLWMRVHRQRPRSLAGRGLTSVCLLLGTATAATVGEVVILPVAAGLGVAVWWWLFAQAEGTVAEEMVVQAKGTVAEELVE